MTFGSFLLSALAVLVLLGVGQRVLDRMHLRDRTALLLIAALFIGGALIPVGICIYLLITADETAERVRGILGAVITSVAVYLLGRFLPSEPERMVLDPLYAYGVAGGAVGWLLGRSRRGAFISGVLGVLLADIMNALVLWADGVRQKLVLGGAGLFDAAVISGILAVLLCELVGETLERAARAQGVAPDRARVRTPKEEKRK